MEEACQDPTFPCAMINGVPRLKRDHKQGYYAQVQGQLALSGLPWSFDAGFICFRIEK